MITLNFDEVLKRIYNAKKGVEVRYGLGQGFEYCKQFADEAQGYATNAKASEKKATDAVAGIEQTKTDAVQAVQNAQSTATTAVTTKQTEAVQAVDDERDAALQQVADSTRAAQTAANAAGNAATAAGGYASNAESSATAASGSASAAATSESNAASSAQSAGTDADRAEAAAALAGTRANTDKTLKTENAPADAAAVGDIVLDPDGNAIFYSKAEVEAKIKETIAAALSERDERDHDVGSFYASDKPTSPAQKYGGTWERIEDCTVWGASDTHLAGTTVEAGLPNVKGTFIAALRDGFTDDSHTRITGAFYENGTTTGEDSYNSISTNVGIPSGGAPFGFDASRSNSIYGASDTVQPPAYCLYLWRRVA